MKRVYCLYRVSTLGQVENNDIPMQQQACHAFAEKQGWHIVEEFSEKGVSGFKQSVEQREALVAIKQAAVLKKFDVLLVFMFDCLGRRDDETPFVVEWFVKNGIAVWSVMEGEQRFENHVDKLLNYIRFWQSSGESIKTALRTRVRMEQLMQENGYVGGIAPYGYKLCRLGRINKRGMEVHDLLIDPKESEVVKTIFRLYCEEDMGPYRIARYLAQQKIFTRREAQWNAASIRNVLGNISYTGIRKYGALQTERFSHLQIISDEIYLCAQKKLRSCCLENLRPTRSQHWSAVLLQSRPYCMHCGKPMTVTRNRKIRRKRDGTVTVYDRMKYICMNKSSVDPCTGQRNYSAQKIDQLLLAAVEQVLFSNPFEVPAPNENSALSRCQDLAQLLTQEEAVMEVLKAEVIEVLRGTSAFGPALLNDLIEKSESKIAKLNQELKTTELEFQRQKIRWNRFCATRTSLLAAGVADLSRLTLSQQQELAALLIDRVELGRGGIVRIHWTFGGTACLGADASG